MKYYKKLCLGDCGETIQGWTSGGFGMMGDMCSSCYDKWRKKQLIEDLLKEYFENNYIYCLANEFDIIHEGGEFYIQFHARVVDITFEAAKQLVEDNERKNQES